MSPKVTFVTGNANKLREVKAILEPTIQVESKSLEIDEIQGSINEITQSKCRKAAELVGLDALLGTSQSTSLTSASSSKHFLTTTGHDGLNKLLAAYPDKSAEAVWQDSPGAWPSSFRFAEMDAAQKNAISHRARALEMLKKWFLEPTSSKPDPPAHDAPSTGP
ncbi:hypothetical protein CDD80_642 [Ophiocordyceps camponoti-rufipedis]|uniref:Non-canonical purine NTP pyrophosphatase n=1 Tax=Ophiocordyceps camponoti-rufipedis TaxID=2004952 RepID=A0A2C5XY78_9HYPO|nr:hypothetical protein CDD80_642 [Ophiocordyceps camponoti-rufipedis]